MRDSALAPTPIFPRLRTLVVATSIATLSCAQHNSGTAQRTGIGGLSRDQALAELRRQGVEFNEQSFLRSIGEEKPALVNLFLVAGVNPNSNEMGGITALMIAAGLRRPGPNTGGCIDGIIHPCYSIAKKTTQADLDIVRSLIKGGADVQARDGDGDTALHKAAIGGNLEVAKILIANGADVNTSNHYGTTPLMLAGETSMAELLVANGAMVSNKDTHLSPALLNAASAGYLNTLRFLISKGADIRSRGSQGTTALMQAASGGHVEILDFLLDRGVEADVQDAGGYSALMYAAFNGRANCVELLLKRGANRALTNRAGETASAIATKRKFASIVKLLE